MSNLTIVLAVAGAVLGLGYLVLRVNSLWIYRLIDRSLRNSRATLPPRYDVPRYFVPNKNGEPDTSIRWPGWDGWYCFLLPEDGEIPVTIIRVSVMTGLYGLNGVDDYRRLSQAGLSSFDAIEYLTYYRGEQDLGNLSRHYLPKDPCLALAGGHLDVSVASPAGDAALGAIVRGSWPDYELRFSNPQGGLEIDLRFHGDSIEWWADIPHVFTYFAAFGTFDGRVTCRGFASQRDESEGVTHADRLAIRGVGGFEHGFARKPFNFDGIWLPVRALKAVFPRFKPIRYHYELFVGGDECRGGFMCARGFGIDFRNRGGVFLNGAYRPIRNVKIRYLERLEPDPVASDIYRRWEVRAMTDDGVFAYVATLEMPPARITRQMMYYGYSFEGSYQGRAISGRGYGEYLRI